MQVDPTFYYAWAIKVIRIQCMNTFQVVKETCVDQAKEGQIKTCKMEKALAVNAAADHVDRVKNYPQTKRSLCH